MVKKVTFTCSMCNESVSVDITHFNSTIVMTDFYHCKNNHKTTLKFKDGKIIDKNSTNYGDIEDYPGVPKHLKEFIKEAYVCQNEKASKAGATLVRLILDGFLWELRIRDRYVGTKVNTLKTKCTGTSYKNNHRALCSRVPVFSTVADLAGYHAHAQPKVLQVNETEFATYLHTVEAAIKEKWPKP